LRKNTIREFLIRQDNDLTNQIVDTHLFGIDIAEDEVYQYVRKDQYGAGLIAEM
jgi:hypothetical protein